MIVVVAGVSGTGKSTIGEALSTALAIPFFDADDYHPQKNIINGSKSYMLHLSQCWALRDEHC